MQIIPGVYLVNGFPYSQHQNSYVVRDGDLTVLVDSGDLRTDTFPLVRGNAARWGIDLTQLDYMLITHAHFDQLLLSALGLIDVRSRERRGKLLTCG